MKNLERYRRSIKSEALSSVLLLICTISALCIANSSYEVIYNKIIFDNLFFRFPLNEFINDFLMFFFFLNVGLEIKENILYGNLSSIKKASFPVIGSIGGVIVPAIIFLIFNFRTDYINGFCIPISTDIAFAVGILSILGDRVPVSLKVFLTALAIADDLIAILVVAIFYGGAVRLDLLAIAVVLICLVVLMNKLGEKRVWFYLVPAIIIWSLFYYAGIHSTMSGVVMAFLIPMTPRFSEAYFQRKRKQYERRIAEYSGIESTATGFPNGPQRHCLRRLSVISRDSISMSSRLEHLLSPWVNFLIMPIFALANAGVEIPDLSYFNVFSFDAALGGVGMGVFLGLLIGKPLGISLASFIAIKLRIGEMPSRATWRMLIAVACLGGIGFTMSIFVDTLSFGNQAPEITSMLRDMGKVAVLMGSLCAGLLGSLLINIEHSLETKKTA